MSGTAYKDLSGNNTGGGVSLNDPDSREQAVETAVIRSSSGTEIDFNAAGAEQIDACDNGQNETVIKDSAGVVTGVFGSNGAAYDILVTLYDVPSVPDASNTTPVVKLLFPAGETGGYDFPNGLRFDEGIARSITKTDMSDVVAADMTFINILYQ